jgi:Arc/MetJ family transcription regulator
MLIEIGISLILRSGTMALRKTSVEVDDKLVRKVRRILGTSTLKETVEAAFLAVLQQHARREEVDALKTMRGMDLDKPDIMAAAWRA